MPARPSPGWHHRQRVWRHNSFKGFAAMTSQNMQAIIDSDTTYAEAKALARQIQSLAGQLYVALSVRKDPTK